MCRARGVRGEDTWGRAVELVEITHQPGDGPGTVGADNPSRKVCIHGTLDIFAGKAAKYWDIVDQLGRTINAYESEEIVDLVIHIQNACGGRG